MSLIERPRRLRASQAMRNLVAETNVVPSQLIYPTFIKEGLTEPKPIKGLPGVFQNTEASLLAEVDRAIAAGIGGIMIFGIPAERDELGSAACEPNGILNRAVAAVRERAGDKLVVVADLCLDEFTSHGHCGVLDGHGNVDNDATLIAYGKMAVALAKAGAHMLGASGMMDGQVGYVRAELDKAGFIDVSILAYSAKYASAFYGPFRDAVESELDGDRRTYQQDRVPSTLTVGAYLKFIARGKASRAEIDEILEFFGCPTYYTPLSVVDVGTRRLIEVAAGVASKPKLLMLDEPAAGLDHEQHIAFGERLRQVPTKYGVTLLIIEHDLDLVRSVTTELTVLNFGEVLASGSQEEVLTNKEVLKAYMGETEMM